MGGHRNVAFLLRRHWKKIEEEEEECQIRVTKGLNPLLISKREGGPSEGGERAIFGQTLHPIPILAFFFFLIHNEEEVKKDLAAKEELYSNIIVPNGHWRKKNVLVLEIYWKKRKKYIFTLYLLKGALPYSMLQPIVLPAQARKILLFQETHV